MPLVRRRTSSGWWRSTNQCQPRLGESLGWHWFLNRNLGWFLQSVLHYMLEVWTRSFQMCFHSLLGALALFPKSQNPLLLRSWINYLKFCHFLQAFLMQYFKIVHQPIKTQQHLMKTCWSLKAPILTSEVIWFWCGPFKSTEYCLHIITHPSTSISLWPQRLLLSREQRK